MDNRRNAITAGIAFGVLFGLYITIQYGYNIGIPLGLFSGLASGSLLYLFVTSKVVTDQTAMIEGKLDTVLHSGGANHFKNMEAVGGKLYLLKDRLYFKSHSFNIQNHELKIMLTDVKEIRTYNNLGIIPNGLTIVTREGKLERFVVNGRAAWKDKISQLLLQHLVF